MTTAECGHLREQAFTWLRADLDARRALLEKEREKVSLVVGQRMEHWLRDTDLNGVRLPEALAKLPGAERQKWEKFWKEVEELKQRAVENK